MSEDARPSDTGTKILDYIALGLLLAPPAVVVKMAIKGEPIDWRKTAIATIACWLGGSIAVWASHNWKSWQSVIPKAIPYFVAAESKFWVKGAIVATAMGGALALSSILSPTPQGDTNLTQVRQQQLDEDQKQISEAQDAAHKAEAEKGTAERDLHAANQQIGTLQSQLNAAQHAISTNHAPNGASQSLSTDDIATQIGIWESVDTPLSDLNTAINEDYSLLGEWSEQVKLNKDLFVKSLNTANREFATSLEGLLQLRNTFKRDYPDIFAQVNAEGPLQRLYEVSNNLIYQIGVTPEPLPPDFEFRLRPYVDVLKRALDTAKSWQADIQKLSIQRRKELTEMKPQ